MTMERTDSDGRQRFGMVIGLKDERCDEYLEFHQSEGVRDLLSASNIQNFNIFLQRMPDGQLYEFAFYEYVGSDYATDMSTLNNHPRNIEWLKICDPMQIPLPGHSSWVVMKRIYFNP